MQVDIAISHERLSEWMELSVDSLGRQVVMEIVGKIWDIHPRNVFHSALESSLLNFLDGRS